MKFIDEYILADDKAICDNIDDLEFKSRGKVAQNMLSYFRNLVEHIAVKIFSMDHEGVCMDYKNIHNAVDYLKTSNEYYFIRKFHKFLQESRSHYTPDEDTAERLLLKYYEYLIQIKDFMQKKFHMTILQNVDKFPTDMDDTLQQYYEKIVEKLQVTRFSRDYLRDSDRFYVQKCKAFFVNHHVYYEITLIPANDEMNKYNRLVVFSTFKITVNYAVKVDLEDDVIEIVDKFMPIKIMIAWSPSIRPCELNNFAKIFGKKIEVRSDYAEYNGLMNYILKTGMNLVEILESSDIQYDIFKKEIARNARKIILCDIFDESRKFIKQKKFGCNCVRYLLLCLNNTIIKAQLSGEENYKMKGLYLTWEALPFEEMPYNKGLRRHNPSIYDLYDCINLSGHEHELLARHIEANANTYGKLYTKIEELDKFENIENMIQIYNNALYKKHKNRSINIFGKNLFIQKYEDETQEIMKELISYSSNGIMGYRESVDEWLINNPNIIDCDEKRAIILEMFSDSKIAMIYGAAGTGKSTLLKHISQLWIDSKKVYIANTHPAVENLRRRVQDGSGEYLTIKKYISTYRSKVDILFIDECSMVSNQDMVEILRKKNFELLVLVGDIYQIEAIQFGNWFNLARYFVPPKSQYELTKPYRTNNEDLLELWNRVRNYKDNIAEWLGHCNYTAKLDETIFEPAAEDEIVLCLNYDGLYGINNINRFLQNANPNPPFLLGVWVYKVGDCILFSESSKYNSILYNNLKGKIVNIEETEEEMLFSVEINKVLNSVNVSGTDLELLPSQTKGKSVVKFAVKKKMIGDDDGEENDVDTNVPFQIAYAVSIHKAQGLEFKSVKIVITKEIDELISVC